MNSRCPSGWRSSDFLGKDREKYGPQDPLVVQEGGREGDGVSDLVGEVPWIPNGEVIDARSHTGLVRRREGGGLSPFFISKKGGYGRGYPSDWSLFNLFEGRLPG